MKKWMPLVIVVTLLTGCASVTAPPSGEVEGVRFEQLAPGVWLHTSYRGRTPSNGLIVVDGDTATLVDTAWTDDQTATVLDWVESELGLSVSRAVFTHAHVDKMGGVATVRQRGIATYAHRLSNEAAPSRGLVPAEFDLEFDDARSVDLGALTVFYPGPGHTPDNIVVWHARSRVLFGGCLIRPGHTTTLGNTADAVVSEWALSVERVAKRFEPIRVVVPSHGVAADAQLLDATVALARAATPD